MTMNSVCTRDISYTSIMMCLYTCNPSVHVYVIIRGTVEPLMSGHNSVGMYIGSSSICH